MDRNYYVSQDYITKERFICYWHQINEILNLKPSSVLEVGMGNAVVASFLKERNIRLYTVDLLHELTPDIVGNVMNMPFSEGTFDVVACFQMLEHLPYDNFVPACKELYRVTKKNAVISLPDSNRAFCFYFDIPKIGIFKKLIALPRFTAPEYKFNGEHYWEIGFKGYPLKKIIADIRTAGFEIMNSYRVLEYRHHRFFILKK